MLFSRLLSSPPCLATFGIQTGREREALLHTRLSKGRSRWREETASVVFAPDKSTSRSAFKNVVICVCIRARAPAGLACACPVVRERAIVHRDGGFRGYVGLNDQKRRMDQLLLISPEFCFSQRNKLMNYSNVYNVSLFRWGGR